MTDRWIDRRFGFAAPAMLMYIRRWRPANEALVFLRCACRATPKNVVICSCHAPYSPLRVEKKNNNYCTVHLEQGKRKCLASRHDGSEEIVEKSQAAGLWYTMDHHRSLAKPNNHGDGGALVIGGWVVFLRGTFNYSNAR